MKRTFNLIKTEFKRFFNNDVLVAIFFGAPLLYGILFGFVYRQAKVVNLPVAVVDMDQSELSDKIIDALNDNENIDIKDVFSSTANLKEEHLKKDYVAVIRIPEHFQNQINQARHPELLIELNMSNILNANFASKSIQRVLGTLNAGIEIEALKKKGLNPEIAKNKFESFKISYHKLYNPNSNYLYFMLPALLGAIMQQVIFLAMALVFSRDFEDGYWKKLTSFSKNPFYLIFIKLIPYLILSAIVWTIVGIIYNYFEIAFNVFNFPMLWIVILLTLAAMFIGMLFSLLIPSQLKATEFLMVISTPAFILSGFTWPLSAMPKWIKFISNAIPLTHFLQAFKKIAIYGGSFGAINSQMKALLIIIIVSFTLTFLGLALKLKSNE